MTWGLKRTHTKKGVFYISANMWGSFFHNCNNKRARRPVVPAHTGCMFRFSLIRELIHCSSCAHGVHSITRNALYLLSFAPEGRTTSSCFCCYCVVFKELFVHHIFNYSFSTGIAPAMRSFGSPRLARPVCVKPYNVTVFRSAGGEACHFGREVASNHDVSILIMCDGRGV